MEPKVAQKGPYRLDLQPGIYWWCASGQSGNQPFCDGSHKGGGIEPVEFEVIVAGLHVTCGSNHSAKNPICDGSHKNP